MKKERLERENYISFFNMILIVGIDLLIVLGFGNYYYDLQVLAFSNSNTLLFIHDSLSKKIIVFASFIILFCILLNFKTKYSKRIMGIKIYLFISIVVFVISFFTLIYSFFQYDDLNREGIRVRNGITITDKNYIWNDIEYVEVSYERGYKNEIDIIYNIHLYDGTILNACNSKEFFNKITDLDKFMKSKDIKIIRSNIKAIDYGDFEKRYKGERMQVILELFNK
ncbi:hypothetical protein [Clostridium saccharoperbutylacetonicum]